MDVDAIGGVEIVLRAGGVDRRSAVGGPSPLDDLLTAILAFDPGDARTWAPSRSWGSLLDASPYLEAGTLPDPAATGTIAWPWPDVVPEDFEWDMTGSWGGYPRRAMSAAELAAIGSIEPGDVIERVYLRGPDGTTIYAFATWPMAPDELD